MLQRLMPINNAIFHDGAKRFRFMKMNQILKQLNKLILKFLNTFCFSSISRCPRYARHILQVQMTSHCDTQFLFVKCSYHIFLMVLKLKGASQCKPLIQCSSKLPMTYMQQDSTCYRFLGFINQFIYRNYCPCLQ